MHFQYLKPSALLNRYIRHLATSGETGVIAVEFFPAGASHFFPFPMDEVENQSVALADIYGREIREVEQQIGEVADLKEKVRII